MGSDALGDKGEAPGGQGGPGGVSGAVGLGACTEHKCGDVLAEPKDWAIDGQGVSPSAAVDFSDVPGARGGRKEVIACGEGAVLWLQFFGGLQERRVKLM